MGLRSFGKDSLVYGIGGIMQRASTLIIVPLYTHLLSIEEYGKLETILVTINIVSLAMGLGMSSSIIRFYMEDEGCGKTGELLGSAFAVSIAGGMLIFSILLAFADSLSPLLNIGRLRLTLAAACTSAFFESIYQLFLSMRRARSEPTSYVILSLLAGFALVLFTCIILILSERTALMAVYGRSMAFGAPAIILLVNLFARSKLNISFNKIQEIARFGVPVVFSASAWFVLDASDRYFLAHYSSFGQVAIYSLGSKLGLVLAVFVVWPFQLTYAPYVFQNLKRPDLKQQMSRLLTYLVAVMASVSIMILIFSRKIIELIAPQSYESSNLVTAWILPAAVMTGIYYWASAQIHIAKGTHYIAATLVITAAVNLGLNYWLIPPLGWLGAAISKNASFGLAALCLTAIGQRLFPLRFEAKRLLMILCAASVSLIGLVLTYSCRPEVYWSVNMSLLLFDTVLLYFIGFFDESELAALRAVGERLRIHASLKIGR